MKLPIKSLLSRKEKSEYILALLLRSEKASAVIIQESDGKIKSIGKHEEYFPKSIEGISTEELLDALDRTISRAESTLPPDVEVVKTIFGVKDTWVEEKRIKKEYLAKLKKVSDELHLSPIGFLVISEAIAHLIQEEEGAPLSSIIAEIGKSEVTISLFRAGKCIETKSATIKESIAGTVDDLLKHFTSVEVLPSRVIVFNGDRDEELAQEFISHHWSKSLPFLHVPQVSVLPVGFDARAVVYGAAMQMGFEVLGAHTDKPTEDIKVLPSQDGKTSPQAEDDKSSEETETEKENSGEKDEEGQEKELTEDKKEIPIPTHGDNFGFVMEKDVATTVPHQEPEKHPHDTHEKETHSNSGHENVKEPVHEREEESESEPYHSNLTAVSEEPDYEPRRERTSEKGLPIAALLATVTGFFAKLPLRSIRLPSVTALRTGSKLIFIPPVVILFLIVGVLWYMFRLQADVIVNVTPKIEEENREVTFSVTSPNDYPENIIQAKSISTTIEGSVSTNTTGKKEIGDKAKGTVTLFNSDDSKKELDAGTVIKSANDLEFVLDKDVAIASASGDIFSGIKSGQAKADVTAKSIGTEYNLPSNTKFTISSTLAARNDSAFSGGSKKTVQVVAKKDIEKLTKELPTSLQEKAIAEIEKKVSGGETVLPGFIGTSLTKQSLSKKEGEEAKTLTLKANVAFEGVAYSDEDLKGYAESLVKDEISDDSAIADNGLSFDVEDIEKESDEEVSAKLNIKAGLLPKIDNNAVLVKITGKSFADAEKELKKLPQVTGLDVKLKPNIPLLPKYLPRVRENINLVIHANE